MSYTIKECVLAIDELIDKKETFSFTGKRDDLVETIQKVESYLDHMKKNVDRWNDFMKSERKDGKLADAISTLFLNESDNLNSIISSIEKRPIIDEKEKEAKVFSYLQAIYKALNEIDPTPEEINVPSNIHEIYRSVKTKVLDVKKSLYHSISINTIQEDLRLITVCMRHIRNLIKVSKKQLLNIKSLSTNNEVNQEQINEYIQIEMFQVKKLVQQIGNTLDITGPAAKRIHAKVRQEFILPTLSHITGLIDSLSLIIPFPIIGPIY